MVTVNRTTQQDRDRKTMAAIQKYLMQLTSILIAGVSYTPAQLTALFKEDSDIADAATNARQDFLAAATAARNQRAKMGPIRAGFRSFLMNMFTDPSTIAEFGFTTRKRAVPSAETTAAAVDKRNATRAARHTMGKNQKKAVETMVVSSIA
jgi:hypothetical protein